VLPKLFRACRSARFDQRHGNVCVLPLSSEAQRRESGLIHEVHIVTVFFQVSGNLSRSALQGCIVEGRASGPVNVVSHVRSM